MKSIVALSLLFAVWFQPAMAADTFNDCADCPEMVVIPAGSVTLGSAENSAYRRKGERPLQKVSIRNSFAMARTETTLAEYRRFVAATQHEPEPLVYDGKTILGCNFFFGSGYGYVTRHSWKDPGYPQREDAPVVCVSWSDAERYAQWLSELTGREYRIPSTQEFEYAQRAGAETPWFWGAKVEDGCEYANLADQTFARTYPERASIACNDGHLYTAPVGRFTANAFGLHDMVGNVWEWTNDCWHDDLQRAPKNGSSWLEAKGGDCAFRTPKGGSWISGAGWSRAAVRSKDPAHYRSFMLGFRVVAEVTSK